MQHFFSNIISKKRKSDFKRDQQKRAIIQNLARSYSFKKCNEPEQHTTFGPARPNLLAIVSSPYLQTNEPKLTSKLSMRDEWKRINCSFPIKIPLATKLNQTALPKVPLSVQFSNNPNINRFRLTASASRVLRSVSAFGSSSSTTSVNKHQVGGNRSSTRALAEPFVEEPASDEEDEKSQTQSKHNSESESSEPEEEDGIIIEKAIPIAKGCDSTNISSRVFQDRKYLNSLFNCKVTLHISEISELFSYENDEDVQKSCTQNDKTTETEYLSDNCNGRYSETTTKTNGELISSKAHSTSKSSVNSSWTDCNNIHTKPSTSKLHPLNISTPSFLSSTSSSSQSLTSPLSPNSLKSPLSPPLSVYSRKKIPLTGAKKCVLESYPAESEKTTSKMPIKKVATLAKSNFHPSSIFDRLTSEMIDNGALLSEDEEDKEKEMKKIKLKNRRKKDKTLLNGTNKSSTLKRSFKEDFEEDKTIIRPSESSPSECRSCRRSVRNRVRPLDFWTGQRPLYQVTIDNKGSPLKTLVGVQAGNAEPKRRKNAEPKRHLKNDKNQKMINIFNLSINNPRFAKKFTNTDLHDHEHVLAFNQVEFRESSKSPGVFTALTKKASNIAFGKLKFTPKSVKRRTKTGNYISHFNVVYGTLLLKLENEKVGSIIKTGFYFHIGEQTNYTLTNLRNDEAMIDFTIIKEN